MRVICSLFVRVLVNMSHGKQYMEHFVKNDTCTESLRREPWLRRGVPERRAQTYHVGFSERESPSTRGTIIISRLAAKYDSPSSSQFLCNCTEPPGDNAARSLVTGPRDWP